MLTATKEKPSTVVVVVSLEDNSESETRYISGKTVKEVVAELFGEKPEKEKKPRKARTPKGPSGAPELPSAAEGAQGQEKPEPPSKKKKDPAWAT